MSSSAPETGQRPLSVLPGRVPPQSLDAERSVLGGVLLDNQALDDLLEVVKPEDFYRESHRKIFEAMVALAARTEPIDRVTVKDELRAIGALEAVGGEGAIDLLDTVVPSAANLVYYGAIVREKSISRRIIETAHSIASMGYEQKGATADFIDYAESRMLAACESRAAGEGPVQAKGIVVEVFKAIERDFERGLQVTGLPTGLDALDVLTTGFQGGDFIVVAARPSLGKSALGFEVGGRTAVEGNLAVGVFSLEMPKEQVIRRMMSQRGEVDGQRLRTGQLRESDWPKLAKVSGPISESPLEIDDQAGLSSVEIRGRARRLRSKYAATKTPLGLVVVDYLQLMGGEGQHQEDVISRNSKGLKNLARELGVPVIALCQLNRAFEKRDDKRPVLSDLRGSGSIEQDADTVLFLHRPKRTEDLVEIIIGKQRNGPVGIVEVVWREEFTRFENKPSDARLKQLELQGPPPHTDDDRRYP